MPVKFESICPNVYAAYLVLSDSWLCWCPRRGHLSAGAHEEVISHIHTSGCVNAHLPYTLTTLTATRAATAVDLGGTIWNERVNLRDSSEPLYIDCNMPALRIMSVLWMCYTVLKMLFCILAWKQLAYTEWCSNALPIPLVLLQPYGNQQNNARQRGNTPVDV